MDRLGSADGRASLHVVPLGHGADPADVRTDDAVVNVATSDPATVRAWARAGSAAGGYLDAVPTAASQREVAGEVAGPAPIVAGVGFAGAVGDALAVVAGSRLAAPTRVDVTVYVPGRRSLLATATPRERADLVEAWVTPMDVLVDGRMVTERIAEQRRLAWFPRPVGPHHAVAVPGTHARSLPGVVPGLQTVRTALALPSSIAEVVQAGGNLARWGRGRDLVRRLAARPGRGSDSTTQERWALVVEVVTEAGDLVRGWAYGHDRHGVTAEVVALLGHRLVDPARAVPAGLVGATQVVPAEHLLDALAARTDLRWSVTEPAPTD